MTVIPPDTRQVVNPSDKFPFPAVTAIDIKYSFADPIGSGIVISPNHVLSAAHNGHRAKTSTDAIAIRATTSGEQSFLNDRAIGAPGDPFANVINRDYVADFKQTKQKKDDIVLFETSNTLLLESQVVGLIAFVDPKSAKGLSIETAGYPGDNVSSNIPPDTKNSGLLGRDLVVSPGDGSTGKIVGIKEKRRFFYSPNVDTFGGQSGSGVWHSLDGEKPRVLGIHTAKVPSGLFTIKGNNGVLITTDIYKKIINQIADDSGTENADLLPENAIIGRDSGFSFGGNDEIFGTYRRERIIGNGGNDELFGGGADDRLEGGDGVDQALFSDVFTNYDYTINDPTKFEFFHSEGSQIDGTDTTQDIEFGVFEFTDTNGDKKDDDDSLFFVPLQVDPKNSSKLKDGPLIYPKEDILNEEGETIATMTVESPAWMFDGDVDYNLSIGLDITKLYNLALIIDSSGSMAGFRLSQTKDALNELIDSFEKSGLDSNVNFGIVDFDSFASLLTTGNSSEAKNIIDSLIADGVTNYSDALDKANDFFNLPSKFESDNAVDIAYFISDGKPTLPDGTPDPLNTFAPFANALKNNSDDVRAFGFGNASLSTLNLIDSDADAVLLSSAGNLFDEFNSSVIDQDTIERINVRLGSSPVPVGIIFPDQLVKKGANLTFEGTIEELQVSKFSEEHVTFELLFNDGTPSVSLNYKITTGQKEVKQQTNNGKKEVITFSVNQSDFFESQSSDAISSDSTNFSSSQDSTSLGFPSNNLVNLNSITVTERDIIGNDLDNIIQIQQGQNTLVGNGGDDRFILLGGTNFVNGGDGVDTVEINLTQAEAGGVSKSGSTVNIGNNYALQNVEFIEFSDVRLAVDTLAITPIISFVDRVIYIPEGDAGSTVATFNFELSSAVTEDVVIDVSYRSDFADVGIDFIEPTGQFTIAAGETSGNLTLEILGDTDIEGDEEIYLDLTIASGATFADGAVSETVGVNILDNETNFITNEDTPIVVLTNRLLSDYAEQLYGEYTDNDFSLIEVSNAVNGTVIFNEDNNIEFTPAANFNGDASFEYTITDGTENNIGLVEIIVNSVNDAPITNDDTVTTDEDIPVIILATELLSNDSDVEIEDSLSLIGIDNSVNGTAILNEDGSIEFTPAANFNGTASFDYIVTDGIDNSTASVEVIVNSVNDAPIANNDTATTDEDTSVTILATELLSNDINVDPEDSLSLIGIDNFVNGTAILNENGSIEFTPDANFNGTASFDYTITDGIDNSTASVAVIVNSINDVPIVTNLIPDFIVTKNAPNSIIEFVDNFEDVEDGDSFYSYRVSARSIIQGGTANKFFDLVQVDAATKTITLDYVDNVIGTSTITVRVTDRDDEFVETSFTLDVIDASENENILVGKDGDDYLAGKDNKDTLSGGNGNDTLLGLGDNDSLDGQADNDSLNGGDGNDSLLGSNGDDTLMGEKGNDSLLGGNHDDSLNGGNGQDTLNGGNGADILLGQSDDDTLNGNNGNDTLNGGAGPDKLYGQNDDDTLNGGNGKDTLGGGLGADKIYGQNDDDRLVGNDGNDTLGGGSGADRLDGQNDDDRLSGSDGNDTLNGGPGADKLFGQNDDDTLNGGDGNDTLNGGLGADQLFGQNDADQLFGQNDDDTLNGGDGSDTLGGGLGADQLFGQNDDDRLWGGDGNDTLGGGAGADKLYGHNGDDRLWGGDGNDTLGGDAGADKLYGHDDDDRLVGGLGVDSLTGGAGNDRFVIVSGLTGDRDIIQDYQDGFDLLDLTGGLTFGNLTINQNGVNTDIIETATNETLATLMGIDAVTIDDIDFV